MYNLYIEINIFTYKRLNRKSIHCMLIMANSQNLSTSNKAHNCYNGDSHFGFISAVNVIRSTFDDRVPD